MQRARLHDERFEQRGGAHGKRLRTNIAIHRLFNFDTKTVLTKLFSFDSCNRLQLSLCTTATGCAFFTLESSLPEPVKSIQSMNLEQCLAKQKAR
jgi:hypothetical protein